MLHLNCSLRVRYISDMALFCIRIADITWSILTLSKFAGATSLGPQKPLLQLDVSYHLGEGLMVRPSFFLFLYINYLSKKALSQ